MSSAGTRPAARVNWVASQQEAEGSSWCWISAARLVSVVQPAQVVEVGETAVRDDDVGQCVRRVANLPEHGVVGGLQGHLQDADAVTTVGDRRDDTPSTLAVRFHMLALAAQDAVVDAALQSDRLGSVRDVVGRGEPYQPLTYEVDEQERHPLRAEPLLQIVRNHIDGLTRRGRLRGGQQLTQFQISTLHDTLPSAAATSSPSLRNITHCAHIGWSGP